MKLSYLQITTFHFIATLMAPLLACIDGSTCMAAARVISRSTLSEIQMRVQWQRLPDILTILLLLGPGIVRSALAQLSGTRLTPVAFSFGSVAYSVEALLSAFGDGQLMPLPDAQCLVVSADSGHTKSNKSWLLNRILRDYEEGQKPLSNDKSSANWEALRVSVFRVSDTGLPGIPKPDLVWYGGCVAIATQIAIAIIPLILYQEWAVLILTLTGTVLSLLQGSLRQWRLEKWACPSGPTTSYCLTKGNGSRHVMVIMGTSKGLDLGILAGNSNRHATPIGARVFMTLLAILWCALLLTVAGLKQVLFAVGLVGTLQNIYAAGSSRPASALGLHLDLITTLKDTKVSKVLVKLEHGFAGIGLSLIPIFFPAGFRRPADEEKFWSAATARYEERRAKAFSASATPRTIASSATVSVNTPIPLTPPRPATHSPRRLQ